MSGTQASFATVSVMQGGGFYDVRLRLHGTNGQRKLTSLHKRPGLMEGEQSNDPFQRILDCRPSRLQSDCACVVVRGI
jgi:hypothetical protein